MWFTQFQFKPLKSHNIFFIAYMREEDKLFTKKTKFLITADFVENCGPSLKNTII